MDMDKENGRRELYSILPSKVDCLCAQAQAAFCVVDQFAAQEVERRTTITVS
jgi:hypothetical protein